MSDPPPSSMSWSLRSASSRISSIKAYLPDVKGAIRTPRGGSSPTPSAQRLKEWAGQKIRRGHSCDTSPYVNERLFLFPGWATRRYRKASGKELQDAFEIEVFVSGFASSHRVSDAPTRGQRAFLRLAKGFASLPKLNSDESPALALTTDLSHSTEALLKSVQLPPRPTDITDDFEVEVLDAGLRALDEASRASSSSLLSVDTSSVTSYVSSLESPESPSDDKSPITPVHHPLHNVEPTSTIASDLRRLHDNLESRLQPFWSTPLPNRVIRIELHPPGSASASSLSLPQDGYDYGPIASQDVVTAADGSFQVQFSVLWEDVCQHPLGAQIAFGNPTHEHELVISAHILPPPPSIHNSAPLPPPSVSVSAHTSVTIPLTYSPVRLISDIDDTIKLSNIMRGARVVFQNVFVKDLRDNVIPGMGEWYGNMYKRGIRFHYVSNGPFELLPVVNEFLQISQLPRGSIRLKSYGGRSLFNGLLSAPATRKRDGILNVLNAFTESRFILVGDTGEQDLELYSTIASERPEQVLGVFVRDAGNWEEGAGPVDDPTGTRAAIVMGIVAEQSKPERPRSAKRAMSDTAALPVTVQATNIQRPISTRSKMSLPGPSTLDLNLPTQSLVQTPLTAEPPAFYLEAGSQFSTPPAQYEAAPDEVTVVSVNTEQWVKRQGSFGDAQKKRAELQVRVWKARAIIPEHIPLRIFRNADECREVDDILERLHVPG